MKQWYTLYVVIFSYCTTEGVGVAVLPFNPAKYIPWVNFQNYLNDQMPSIVQNMPEVLRSITIAPASGQGAGQTRHRYRSHVYNFHQIFFKRGKDIIVSSTI